MKDTYKELQVQGQLPWHGPRLVKVAIAGHSNDWACGACHSAIGAADIDAYAQCRSCKDCALKA